MAIIPVWLVGVALFTLSTWPMPGVMAMLVLTVGVAVPIVIRILVDEPPQRIAGVGRHVDESGTRRDVLARLKPHRVFEGDSHD